MSAIAFCTLCENKGVSGIFRCEGCSQTFCLQHTNEHRQYLTHQLKEIMLENEAIFKCFNDNEQSSLLFDQINQWEKDSIVKIQQTAQNARLQIQQFSQVQKEQTKEKFSQINKQLEEALQTQKYLERDLYRWKILLEQLQYDLCMISPLIIFHQDHSQGLINNIFILKKDQQSILNEKLISSSTEIYFDDKHHVAMHCGPCRAPAHVTGTQEYSSGQHQIRLFISKSTDEFILSFNIMSKLMPMSTVSSDSQYLTYGWQSNDCINPFHCSLASDKHFQDLRGKTKFHIKLFMDCDQQKISYFNEKTKQTREINVDIQKCPLPWKLLFYLYDIGDSVRLLSSCPLS